MTTTEASISLTELGEIWASSGATVGSSSDYRLIRRVGEGYVARARNGRRALVVPLVVAPSTGAGRRASGIDVLPHAVLEFDHDGRTWRAPAAAVVSREDDDAMGAFSVLAQDFFRRIAVAPATWSAVLGFVDEWQALLAPRKHLAPEAEVGLWGELWLIDASERPSVLVAGWRGPERDRCDFFVDGRSVELKTTRRYRVHYVSQSQVVNVAATSDDWVLTLHVQVDPVAGRSVSELMLATLPRLEDQSAFFRGLSRAGVPPNDVPTYVQRYALVSEPEWFRAVDIPRVREADTGVSDLRYRVSLLERECAGPSAAQRLWSSVFVLRSGSTES